MKATVNTTILQDAVARAVKGSSNNKSLILSQLIELKEVEGKLQITTTDFTNYLYITVDADEIDPGFQMAVPITQFSKLVAKTTSSVIKMEVVGTDYVKINANGVYKIPLPLEDEGNPIKFPDKRMNVPKTDMPWQTFNLSTIKALIDVHKPALADDGENSVFAKTPYPLYYFGDFVLSTDTNIIVRSAVNLTDEPMLVSRYLLDLFLTITQEEITVYKNDRYILVCAGKTEIYGVLSEGVNDYNVSAVMPLLDAQFDAEATFNKSELLQALDRVSLFIGEYDDTAIQFRFENNSISLSSKSMTGDEKIQSQGFTKLFSGKINVNWLTTAIKSVVAENVTISYGLSNCIKIQEGTVTQIIALEE